ncbi:MAG: GNAT family N-acetyltransferase [Chloroflexota bacterium]
MIDVQLVPLTKSNWKAVAKLDLLAEQKEFVPSNLYSIAEAQFYPAAQSRAIYSDRLLIGYVLYGIEDSSGEWKIFRFMIDQAYQGQGYGRSALEAVIKNMQSTSGIKKIKIAYHSSNKVAERLYEKAGFVKDCDVDGITTAVYIVAS